MPDDTERQRILAEADRAVREGEVRNHASLGPPLVIIALAGFVTLPALSRFTGPGMRRWLIIAYGITAVGGILLTLFGGSFATGNVRARAERAIGWLAEHPNGPEDERRRMAVTAILDAFYSGGPWTLHTYEFDAARERLGAALPYVMEVEEVLVAESRAYRVFTTAPA